MKYYKNLYISDSAEKSIGKIIVKLNERKFQNGIYLITLSSNVNEQLDIFNAVYTLQPDFPREDLFIIGITKSQDEAFEIVEQITAEVYEQTGAVDIRKYILEKEQES